MLLGPSKPCWWPSSKSTFQHGMFKRSPGHEQHFCSCICALLVYQTVYSTASHDWQVSDSALACGCQVGVLTVLGRMGGRVPCLPLQRPVG